MVQKNGKNFLIEGDNLYLLASLNRNGHKKYWKTSVLAYSKLFYQIIIWQNLLKESNNSRLEVKNRTFGIF
jgi:hypothetical protein